MDRISIGRTQAAMAINEAIWPTLNFLYRWQARMVQVGVSPADPLYLLVVAAYDAMQKLHAESHHLSCKSVEAASPEENETSAR